RASRSVFPYTPLFRSEELAMFRAWGRVFREHNELFTETSWLSVMVGQGIAARGYHPAADLLPDEETLQRLRHIREVVARTAEEIDRKSTRLNSSHVKI